MAITDRNGLAVAVGIERATPAEVTLLEELIANRLTKGKPKVWFRNRLMTAKRLTPGLPSRALRWWLQTNVIESFAPKTAVDFVCINVDGESNAPLRG